MLKLGIFSVTIGIWFVRIPLAYLRIGNQTMEFNCSELGYEKRCTMAVKGNQLTGSRAHQTDVYKASTQA